MRAPILLRALCLALLFSGLHAQAQSTVYRWVDKDGKVQFSDSPPPAEAKDATQKRMGGGYVEEQLPYATQVAVKRNPVVLFATKDCGDICTQGRELLSKRGVPFSEKNPQVNPPDAEELKTLIGELQVPVLLVGTNTVKGYGEESWQSALDQAGYPRTRYPGQPGPRPQ